MPTAAGSGERGQHGAAAARLVEYARLVRLDKPIGIFLLLWPTLWGLWLAAGGFPDLDILLVFLVGVVLMRSAGCVVNDLVDRDLDRHVQRTRDRPLAAGRVRPAEAIALAGALIAMAFLLVLTLNPLTIQLSVVAVLLAITYPFMKRHTYLPQVHLGLAFGWAVPMAFAAQSGRLDAVAWLALIATVLWAVAYDTMYAMVDREDDLRIGVKSTAILFGEDDRLIIGIIQILVILVLLVIGGRLGLGGMYYVGVAGAALFAAYQQFLIREPRPESCFRAFLNNNWFGAAVFVGLLTHYLCAG